MTLASMTGFARARGAVATTAWAWEVKSVNGRGFDLRLRLPPGFDGIEQAARDTLAKVVARGNVQAALTIDRAVAPARVRVDSALLDELVSTGREVAARSGLAPPTIDGLLAIRGVVELVEATETDEERAALHAAVVAGLGAAAEGLKAARAQEGASLAHVLDAHLSAIADMVDRADRHPSRTPEAVRKRLAEGLIALLGEAPALDPQRLHQEAVLVAAKADIREELDRLRAHVAHARRLIADGGAVGRKLDFLAQEFNREANTLCAKSGDRELTEIGLSLKTTVDQLREQVQNVE